MKVDIVIIMTAILMVAVLLTLIIIYSMRYIKVPPNKAMVVFGRAGYFVITGGARFVLPIVESYEFLDLNTREIKFVASRVVTKDSRKIDVGVWCSYRISGDKDALMRSAENLLHKSEIEINEIVEKFISGHLHGGLREFSYENVDNDLGGVAQKIMMGAANDLKRLGIGLAGFELRSIGEHNATAPGMDAIKELTNKIESLDKRLDAIESTLNRR